MLGRKASDLGQEDPFKDHCSQARLCQQIQNWIMAELQQKFILLIFKSKVGAPDHQPAHLHKEIPGSRLFDLVILFYPCFILVSKLWTRVPQVPQWTHRIARNNFKFLKEIQPYLVSVGHNTTVYCSWREHFSSPVFLRLGFWLLWKKKKSKSM